MTRYGHRTVVMVRSSRELTYHSSRKGWNVVSLQRLDPMRPQKCSLEIARDPGYKLWKFTCASTLTPNSHTGPRLRERAQQTMSRVRFRTAGKAR